MSEEVAPPVPEPPGRKPVKAESLALMLRNKGARAAATHRLFVAIALLVAGAFLTSQMLVQSTYAMLGGDKFAAMMLMVSTLSIVTGTVLALYEGQSFCLAAAGVVVALLVVQSHVFSHLTGAPTNLNSLFSMANMLAFPIFSLRSLKANRVFRILFVLSMIYALVYILGYDRFVSVARAGLEAARTTKGNYAEVLRSGVRVLPGDSSRDLRVFLAGAFTTFGFFFALVRLRGGHGLRWLIPLGVMSVAIYMAQSRTYMATMGLISVAYLLHLTQPWHRWLLAALFLIAVAILCSGVPFGWNPMELFGGDQSGAVRANAYRIIAMLIDQSFLTGVGIAPNAGAAAALVGVPSVFWSDLGALGVWYTFGLAGLLIYCAEVVFLIVGQRRPDDMNVANHRTLMLSGMVIGLTSVLSPDIWGGGGGIIAAIALGLLFRQTRPRAYSPLWLVVERAAAMGRRQPMLARWMTSAANLMSRLRP